LQSINRGDSLKVVTRGVCCRQHGPVCRGPPVSELSRGEQRNVIRRLDQTIRTQRFKPPGKRNRTTGEKAIRV